MSHNNHSHYNCDVTQNESTKFKLPIAYFSTQKMSILKSIFRLCITDFK